jgi:GT2 family glycosyltransferase
MDKTKSQPKVTVIILNWNGKEATSECLDSIRNVRYQNFEVILSDNGSDDGSQAYFRSNFSWVNLLENQSNLGFAGGNNAAIRLALRGKPDYILLLNNDTVTDPLFLSELVHAGEARKEVGILNPKIYFYDDPDMLWYAGGKLSLLRGVARHRGFGQIDSAKFDQPQPVNFITGCAFFIKREVIEKIGLLDEEMFCYGEDADWSLRAIKAGYKGWYVPTAKVWHKIGASVSNDFSMFMGTRNAMYLVFKHVSRARFFFFLFIFCFDWVLRNTISLLLSGKFGVITGMYRGFLEFWSMPKKREGANARTK